MKKRRIKLLVLTFEEAVCRRRRFVVMFARGNTTLSNSARSGKTNKFPTTYIGEVFSSKADYSASAKVRRFTKCQPYILHFMFQPTASKTDLFNYYIITSLSRILKTLEPPGFNFKYELGFE